MKNSHITDTATVLAPIPVPELSADIANLNSQIAQFFRFLVAGLLNTGLDLAVMNTAVISLAIKGGAGFAAVKAFSFTTAVVFSYFLNRHWTFRDKTRGKNKEKFAAFAGASLIGMGINVTAASFVIAILKIPVNEFLRFPFLTDGIWLNIAALTGTAGGLLWNFFIYKYIVFKK